MFKKALEKAGIGKDVPLTTDQITNLIEEQASKPESQMREEARAENAVITVALPADRQKYLEYAISLCDAAKKPQYVALLRLKVALATHPEFAGCSKQQVNKFIAHKMTALMKHVITPDHVELLEKEAIEYVQQAITTAKDQGLPIVGGL